MDNRQHFRVSDFMPVEVYDGERRIFPKTAVSPHSVVRAQHGDILDAVLRGLRKARNSDRRSTAQILSILSDELTRQYIEIETLSHGDYEDSRRCQVSLSEGGIRIDVPRKDFIPSESSRLNLKLHLNDNGKPLTVHAHLKGAQELREDSTLMLRFEFTGLSELSRQRLFRYVLQQQARKVRSGSVTSLRQA